MSLFVHAFSVEIWSLGVLALQVPFEQVAVTQRLLQVIDVTVALDVENKELLIRF